MGRAQHRALQNKLPHSIFPESILSHSRHGSRGRLIQCAAVGVGARASAAAWHSAEMLWHHMGTAAVCIQCQRIPDEEKLYLFLVRKSPWNCLDSPPAPSPVRCNWSSKTFLSLVERPKYQCLNQGSLLWLTRLLSSSRDLCRSKEMWTKRNLCLPAGHTNALRAKGPLEPEQAPHRPLLTIHSLAEAA